MKTLILPFSLLLFFCSFSTKNTAQSAWRAAGIGGGSALFHPSISPHDKQIMYAASDVQGMFVTKNGGVSWDVVHFQELIATTESKVNFTSDPDILYTVCEDFRASLVYPCKSEDGGTTWQRIEHPALAGEVKYVFADPNHTDRLLVSTFDELFYSDDGGTSFQQKYIAATAVDNNDDNDDRGLHIGGVFWDGEDIYVGNTDGLLVSNDSGNSFSIQVVEGLPSTFGFLSFSGAKQDDNLRFFSVARLKSKCPSGVLGSTYWEEESTFFCVEKDVSGTWKTMDEGFDFTANGFAFYIAATADDLQTVYVAGSLYANGSVPMVWKTSNGGADWESILDVGNNGNIATGYMGDGGNLSWLWSENAMGFAVSPTDPNMAVITDFSFLHVTYDAGDTWEATYVQPEQLNPMGVPTPTDIAYASNGLENTSAWDIHWSSADDLFALYSDITGLKSRDGGEHWSLDYNGLDYFDEGDSAQRRYNTIYQMSEHPSNQQWYAAASTLHDIYQTHVLEDNEIDGFNELGAIFRSEDKGDNWILVHEFDMPVIYTAIDPSNPEIMYASTVHSQNGGIFKTSNLSAGVNSTWERLPSPPNTAGRAFNVHALNDGTVISTFSGGQTNGQTNGGIFTPTSGVFYSENGGQSWEDRSIPQMKHYTKNLTLDPHDPSQDTWYVGVFEGWENAGIGSTNSGGLYRTTDRGESWEELGDFYRVESATIHPEHSHVMYVATESDGLWYTDNLLDTTPTFILVEDYPYHHPMKVVFNPYDTEEVWITSFGNGLRKATRPVPVKEVNVMDTPVKVSPNPATSMVLIELLKTDIRVSQVFELKIFDLTGRLILEKSFSGASISLNAKDAGTGLFIYEISENSQPLAIGKLVFE